MAVHGIPIKGKQEETSYEELDPDMRKALDIAREKAIERKRLEFLNRGKG